MNARAEAMLDAGAILPTGSAVNRDDTADTLTARSYTHPVLGDQVVVRLVPAKIGAAEDLSLGFLSFTAQQPVSEVGVVRQQALGFPAWALVNDPDNGHHALAMVKEIERLARMAKSRVGPANDGFVAIGDRLARTVPHFLPSYYEEVARAFLAADSITYAARMFTRAREAERAFGLTVDPERQHAVFLEFALAGALTAKALSAHARDLAARCEPGEALATFRRLCVERTLGGLPPYATMHSDLRRLAKAAGLDQITADGLVLADLIGAPAILRAAEPFWMAYRHSFGPICAERPALRGTLLGMFPDSCPDQVWMSILAESGATAALSAEAGTLPAEQESPDGPAGWLSRLAAHRNARGRALDSKRLPVLLELVAAMTSRLIADGQPVTLLDRINKADLDLLDLCLASGIPVADPTSHGRVPVWAWQADRGPGRRDLLAVAADPRLLPLLAAGVENTLEGEHSAERVAEVLEAPGLRIALRYWLGTMATSVVRHGLPTLGGQLERIIRAATPAGLAVNAEASATITGHDLGAVLGRTLRAGVLDEYGWPALDEAAALIASEEASRPDDTDDDRVVEVVEQWPTLLARRSDLVLTVGTDRIEAQHREARLRKQQGQWWTERRLRHVDGTLLICWLHNGELAGYWTNEPDDVFTVARHNLGSFGGLSLPLPDGGRSFGGQPLHVGDQRADQRGSVHSDGERYWRVVWNDGEASWVEFDPASGKDLAGGLPEFLGAEVGDGGKLRLKQSWLRPALGTPAEGVFGQHEGLLGWRTVADAAGNRTGEGIDGRRFALAKVATDECDLSDLLLGAVRFPGSDTTYGVLAGNYGALTICTSDGFVLGKYFSGRTTANQDAMGTALLAPVSFWSQLRPRDPHGSAALRAITDEQASALLADAAGLDQPALVELVAARIPGLSDRRLVAGIAGVLGQAARHAATLADLAAVLGGRTVYPKPDKDHVVSPFAPDELPAHSPLAAATDVDLYEAMDRFLPYCSRTGHRAIQMIQAAVTALAAPVLPAGEQLKHRGDVDFYRLLEFLPVAMVLAAVPTTKPAHRNALVVLLETVAASGLTSRPGARLRRVELQADQDTELQAGSVFDIGSRRLYVTSADERAIVALEYAPDGQFGQIPGHSITAERHCTLPTGAGVVAEQVRQHGPATWGPQIVEALVEAVGMTRTEAVVLLAGLPQRPVPGELGIRAAMAEVATAAWPAYGAVTEILAMLLPEDPAAMWTSGPRLDSVIAMRLERDGKRTPVEEDLVEQLYKAGVVKANSALELLHGIADPQVCRWLDPAPQASPEARATRITTLLGAVRVLPWLAYHLPPQHPIRANLPIVFDRAKQLLLTADTLVEVGFTHDEQAIERIVTALGGTPKEEDGRVEAGPVVIVRTNWNRVFWLRLGLLSGPDDPALSMVAAVARDYSAPVFPVLRMLLAGRFPTAEITDGDPHDPAMAVPDLVAKAAGTLGLGLDATTLYLQLLALPDPTDRNVARWTGWKPARLKAARAELAASDLVVTAKRARSGRTLFLPGAWMDRGSSQLPVEQWKVPLLTIADQSTMIGAVVPLAGLPRVFELAWQRVRDGDVPRFDELDTTERRP